MRKQRNEKNEKTDILHKKWRKQKKAGTVSQVIDGGGAQVGTSERPGMCQPSPLRKISKYVYILVTVPRECVYATQPNPMCHRTLHLKDDIHLLRD